MPSNAPAGPWERLSGLRWVFLMIIEPPGSPRRHAFQFFIRTISGTSQPKNPEKTKDGGILFEKCCRYLYLPWILSYKETHSVNVEPMHKSRDQGGRLVISEKPFLLYGEGMDSGIFQIERQVFPK
ncbi:MAG: hypothetical protein IIC64_17890 [SAR324 cluster bacterium]|nr:hypothetical protein [SAR324 cluster bacterium]